MRYIVTIPVYFNYTVEADTQLEAEEDTERMFNVDILRQEDFPSADIELGDTISIPWEQMHGKEKG